MLGYQYYCEKKYTKAIEWYEEALKQFPDYFVVKYRLAYAYIQLAGNYLKLTKPEFWRAIGHLNDCHKIWENYTNDEKYEHKKTYMSINFIHGKALMGLQNHSDTVKRAFLKANEIESSELNYYNLSKHYYLIGEYEKAMDYIPNSKKYYVLELNALINMAVGNLEVAIYELERIVKFRKKCYLYIKLSKCYLLNHEISKSEKYAKKALKLDKNNHKANFLMGKIKMELGLYDQAKEFLEKSLSIKKKIYNTNFDEAEDMLSIIKVKELDVKENLTMKSYQQDQIENKKVDLKYGVIEKIHSKGYGFINIGRGNLFFHLNDCYQNPKVNDKVSFILGHNKKGNIAIKVCKV